MRGPAGTKYACALGAERLAGVVSRAAVRCCVLRGDREGGDPRWSARIAPGGADPAVELERHPHVLCRLRDRHVGARAADPNAATQPRIPLHDLVPLRTPTPTTDQPTSACRSRPAARPSQPA